MTEKEKLLRAYELSIYLADECVNEQSAELRDTLRELVLGEMTGFGPITVNPSPYTTVTTPCGIKQYNSTTAGSINDGGAR